MPCCGGLIGLGPCAYGQFVPAECEIEPLSCPCSLRARTSIVAAPPFNVPNPLVFPVTSYTRSRRQAAFRKRRKIIAGGNHASAPCPMALGPFL